MYRIIISSQGQRKESVSWSLRRPQREPRFGELVEESEHVFIDCMRCGDSAVALPFE